LSVTEEARVVEDHEEGEKLLQKLATDKGQRKLELFVADIVDNYTTKAMKYNGFITRRIHINDELIKSYVGYIKDRITVYVEVCGLVDIERAKTSGKHKSDKDSKEEKKFRSIFGNLLKIRQTGKLTTVDVKEKCKFKTHKNNIVIVD